MRVRRLPQDDDGCGWTALLPPLPAPRRLSGSERADAAVLGAGVTGLAVARRLALLQPQWRIAVLEARRVGGGASGRNSGFVVDLPHYIPDRGVDGNRRLLRLGRAGLQALREVVRAHAIECDWTEGGRLHGAAGEAGLRALERWQVGADALGEPYERLDREALTALTGTSYYRAGARSPGSVMVQPAALVRGLARALPDSVDLFEESPVESIAPSGGFRLTSTAGALDAPRLFVASNGFTPALGWLRDRMFPLMTFASLTRPLTDDEATRLGGVPVWGLVSELPMGTTLRRLPDRRLLIRNTVRYQPALHTAAASRARIRARHRRDLLARFPMLEAVEFEFTWGGVMGTTFNGAQFFGELTPNLYVAAAYNGVGMAMGTISGELLADLALGADSPLLTDMRNLPPPDRLPPEPARGIGIRATLAYMAKKAHGE
jgi:glycine/D-amino acid oxidase-like deaminating enzyme